MDRKLWTKRIALLIGTMAAYAACAPVEFSQIPEKPAAVVPECQGFNQDCVPLPGRDEFNYTVKLDKPKADILFVNDNSGSMSFEQARIASRFADFIASIDARKLDYRIGVITTDVSDSPNNPPNESNGNGSLQDGRLVVFSDGSRFLTPNSANRESQFSEIMKRQETLRCEQWLTSPSTTDADRGNTALYAKMCPSGDERGILAANKALMRNEESWLREGVPLAVIIISDEDVRSFGQDYKSPTYKPGINDGPSSLPATLKARFQNSKTLAVHSIIVRPGDTYCLNQQNNQIKHPQTYSSLMRGKEGFMYNELTKLTGGQLGSVCASNYSEQMGRIGSTIVDQTPDIPPLACSNPEELTVTLSPQQTSNWNLSGRHVTFSSELQPGTVVKLHYFCPR